MQHIGEYYLRNVPEMASGFKLRDDQSFEFFFSYGALDRFGSGQWKIENGQVAFQSKAWSGSDFRLLESKVTDDRDITVKVTDQNPVILRYVLASLDNGKEGNWHPADEEGMIQFRQQPVNSLSLVFEFCPERFSVIKAPNPAHNYFEFAIEPTLAEYFFNDFRLDITPDSLRGKHPLMNGEKFFYEKS